MHKAIIIDDDLTFARALAFKLEKEYELECEVFRNAEMAFNSIENQPELIFLDYELHIDNRGMDGLMAMKYLQKKYPTIKIVMMSSSDNDHWLKEAERYGAVAYLNKMNEGLKNLETFMETFFKN